MKQKIFEVGKKAYTFNQARYEEDMGRCVITAVSERYITDDIGNKFTVSSDDRDYLTAEGNRTLRLYVSEKEALEDLEHIRITNWINHLVHLRNPETEEKWRLENLINHAWQQYVDLYTEGKEREYLLTYFHCSIMNFIDGHLEDGINYYFFPESKANSLILL